MEKKTDRRYRIVDPKGGSRKFRRSSFLPLLLLFLSTDTWEETFEHLRFVHFLRCFTSFPPRRVKSFLAKSFRGNGKKEKGETREKRRREKERRLRSPLKKIIGTEYSSEKIAFRKSRARLSGRFCVSRIDIPQSTRGRYKIVGGKKMRRMRDMGGFACRWKIDSSEKPMANRQHPLWPPQNKQRIPP